MKQIASNDLNGLYMAEPIYEPVDSIVMMNILQCKEDKLIDFKTKSLLVDKDAKFIVYDIRDNKMYKKEFLDLKFDYHLLYENNKWWTIQWFKDLGEYIDKRKIR